MRRIDAIAIMIAFFGFGGVAFLLLRAYGFDGINAGVWSQVSLVLVLLGWISTYVFRAVTQTMTYNQQLDDYKKAVLTKQLEEMTPEAREKLFAEVATENKLSEKSSKNVVANTKDE
jgi:phosphoglycerol transferase MdoB-like AlkP superfamily enzyme